MGFNGDFGGFRGLIGGIDGNKSTLTEGGRKGEKGHFAGVQGVMQGFWSRIYSNN